MAKEARLTRSELAEWRTYTEPCWDGFKHAWWSRGFHTPPTERQRAFLWKIADARPRDLARWTQEAPGPYSSDVITYIVNHWRSFRSEVFSTEEPDHYRDDRVRIASARALQAIINELEKGTQL